MKLMFPLLTRARCLTCGLCERKLSVVRAKMELKLLYTRS